MSCGIRLGEKRKQVRERNCIYTAVSCPFESIPVKSSTRNIKAIANRIIAFWVVQMCNVSVICVCLGCAQSCLPWRGQLMCSCNCPKRSVANFATEVRLCGGPSVSYACTRSPLPFLHRVGASQSASVHKLPPGKITVGFKQLLSKIRVVYAFLRMKRV